MGQYVGYTEMHTLLRWGTSIPWDFSNQEVLESIPPLAPRNDCMHRYGEERLKETSHSHCCLWFLNFHSKNLLILHIWRATKLTSTLNLISYKRKWLKWAEKYFLESNTINLVKTVDTVKCWRRKIGGRWPGEVSYHLI